MCGAILYIVNSTTIFQGPKGQKDQECKVLQLYISPYLLLIGFFKVYFLAKYFEKNHRSYALNLFMVTELTMQKTVTLLTISFSTCSLRAFRSGPTLVCLFKQ
jgi:hypothetical protein